MAMSGFQTPGIPVTTAITSYPGTLTVDAVMTVTLAAACQQIAVYNLSGTEAIWVTTDGSVPTVGGDNTFMIPAAVSSIPSLIPNQLTVHNLCQVNLISAGAEKFYVQAVTGSGTGRW